MKVHDKQKEFNYMRPTLKSQENAQNHRNKYFKGGAVTNERIASQNLLDEIKKEVSEYS
jgi:hypothetical protein